MTKLPNRWGLIVPWAIFFALVLGWTAYWFVLSGEINRQLEQAKAGLPGGARLDYASAQTSGFPFRLAVDLKEVRASTGDGAMRIATPGVTIAVNVLNPFQLMAFPQSPVHLRMADRDDTLEAERIEMSARLGAIGLVDARGTATNARLFDGRKPMIPPSTAQTLSFAWRVDPKEATARQISLTAKDLRPGAAKPGFEGFGLGPMQLQAGLVLEQASALQLGADPLGAWADGGARLRVEALEATLGDVHLTGEGAFTLDAQRRPQGEIALSFDEPAKALQAVAQSSTIAPEGRAAAQALALGQGLVGGASAIAIRADAGRWRIGPLDLGPVDPVYPLTTP